MEQTATMQLYLKLQQIEFYYQQGDLTITEFIEAKKYALIQAEQTFEQQIINAVDGFPIHTRHMDGEEYYNETYGKTPNN